MAHSAQDGAEKEDDTQQVVSSAYLAPGWTSVKIKDRVGRFAGVEREGKEDDRGGTTTEGGLQREDYRGTITGGLLQGD